jgi:hypothetical protein
MKTTHMHIHHTTKTTQPLVTRHHGLQRGDPFQPERFRVRFSEVLMRVGGDDVARDHELEIRYLQHDCVVRVCVAIQLNDVAFGQDLCEGGGGGHRVM